MNLKKDFMEDLVIENKENQYLIKNNFCLSNFVTTASSNFLKDFWPSYNSTVFELLLKKKFFLVGTTPLDEFACGGTGLLANTGFIYNPIDNRYICGGSSSGSAYAMKKFGDKLSFCLGSDTGGSVIIPSSYCGLIGFKPSYGVISRFGLIPFCSFFDTVGIITDKFKKLEEAFLALNSSDPNDLWTLILKKKKKERENQIKIIIFREIERELSKEIKEIYLNNIKILERENYIIEKRTIPGFIKEKLFLGWTGISFSELTSNLNCLKGITFGGNNPDQSIKEKRTKNLGKTVKQRLVVGYYLKRHFEKEIENLYFWRKEVKKWSANLLKKGKAMFFFPTCTGEAPLIKDVLNKKTGSLSININNNLIDNLSFLGNIISLHTISFPVGKIKKMPVGFTLIGENEQIIFRTAQKISYNL